MEGMLGAVQVGRHSKSTVANNTEKGEDSVKVKYKPLQAFDVYGRGKESERDEKYKSQFAMEENTLRVKDEDRSRHKPAISIDCGTTDQNTSCNNQIGSYGEDASSELAYHGESLYSELEYFKKSAFNERGNDDKTGNNQLSIYKEDASTKLHSPGESSSSELRTHGESSSSELHTHGESLSSELDNFKKSAFSEHENEAGNSKQIGVGEVKENIKEDYCEEVKSRKLDVSRLHKTIEQLTIELNNNKYEVDEDATFNSFLSNGLLTTSTNYTAKSTTTKTDQFTSDRLFTGHEVKCINSKTNDTFATIHLSNPTSPDTVTKRRRTSSLPSSAPSKELKSLLSSMCTPSPHASPIGFKQNKTRSPSPSPSPSSHHSIGLRHFNFNRQHSCPSPSSPINFKHISRRSPSPSSSSPIGFKHTAMRTPSPSSPIGLTYIRRRSSPSPPRVQNQSTLRSPSSSPSSPCSPIASNHGTARSTRPSSHPRRWTQTFNKENFAGGVSPKRKETKRSNSFTDVFTGPKRYSAPNILTGQMKASLSKLSPSPVNYISTDFGSCISPDTKPFAGLTKKLHTWAHRNNFNKPSKRIRNSLSETFPDYSQQRTPSPGSSSRQQFFAPAQKILGQKKELSPKEKSYNVSREREIAKNCFLQGYDFSLSSNSWYYGEMDILISFDDEEEEDESENCVANPERQVTTGSLLVLLDKCQNLYYSFTYWMGNKLHIGSIPFQSGKYSIDFTSTEQLKFHSAKFLIAHLIEQNYLFRVPFTWLLDNLPYSMTSVRLI